MRFSTLSILAIVAYCTATPINPQELSSRQVLELSEADNVPRGVADSYNSPQEREVSDISMLVARAATQDNSDSKIQDLSTRASSHSFSIPGKNSNVKFTIGKLAVAVAVDGANKVMMSLINDGLSSIKWILNDLNMHEVVSGTVSATTGLHNELVNLPQFSPGNAMYMSVE